MRLHLESLPQIKSLFLTTQTLSVYKKSAVFSSPLSEFLNFSVFQNKNTNTNTAFILKVHYSV